MIAEFAIGDLKLLLNWTQDVFEPNFTTRKLASALTIPPGARCLDLGCGVGPLAIFAALKGAAHVMACDVDPKACDLAQQNVARLGLGGIVQVRSGSLFEPVQGETFDVIINDVSGVAESVARLSAWYPETVKSAGPDGTDLTQHVLTNATFAARRHPVLSAAKPRCSFKTARDD